MDVQNYEIAVGDKWMFAKHLADMCLQKTSQLRDDFNYYGYKDYLYSEIECIARSGDAVAYLKQYMQSALDMGLETRNNIWKFQFMAAYDIANDLGKLMETEKGGSSDGTILQH